MVLNKKKNIIRNDSNSLLQKNFNIGSKSESVHLFQLRLHSANLSCPENDNIGLHVELVEASILVNSIIVVQLKYRNNKSSIFF